MTDARDRPAVLQAPVLRQVGLGRGTVRHTRAARIEAWRSHCCDVGRARRHRGGRVSVTVRVWPSCDRRVAAVCGRRVTAMQPPCKRRVAASRSRVSPRWQVCAELPPSGRRRARDRGGGASAARPGHRSRRAHRRRARAALRRAHHVPSIIHVPCPCPVFISMSVSVTCPRPCPLHAACITAMFDSHVLAECAR